MLVVSRACAIASDILVVATLVFYTRGQWPLTGDLDKRMPTLRILIQRDGTCCMPAGDGTLTATNAPGFVMFSYVPDEHQLPV